MDGSTCRGDISIHTPRVGRDTWNAKLHMLRAGFQSTRPVWGVTSAWQGDFWYPQISIHTPRVGRDNTLYFVSAGLQISIHTPRVGRDSKNTQISLCVFAKTNKKLQFFERETLSNHFSLGIHQRNPQFRRANPPGNLCILMLRITQSSGPPAYTSVYSQNALSSSHTVFPDNKIVNCPFPHP